jgi:serine protease
MPRGSFPLSAALIAAVLANGAPANAQTGAPHRHDEVIVRYAPDADRTARAAAQRATGTGQPRAFAPRTRVLKIKDGETVKQTIEQLQGKPGVLSATPNYIARASAFIPNDPGKDGTPAGWQNTQWNLMPVTGVNAPDAWENLIRVGRPGGAGVKVAVLDTGVAYADRGRFRKSPDLDASRFIRGKDFVDDDPFPSDQNGHGTHVASTIAEATNNGVGMAGLAYGARIMPVRVLDRLGEGDAAAIAQGIRFAARRGAQIINLSFEFSASVTRTDIPEIIEALRYARRRNVLVVGASGNMAAQSVAYPARANQVFAVGATTEHICQAEYSNDGPGLDIVAPGGGPDAPLDAEADRCRPDAPAGRDIVQMTFAGSVRRFGFPGGYMGTSMAAPHVSATAALVIASGVIGARPTPAQLESRLKSTSTDLGPPGYDTRYGAGLLNAAAATAPVIVTSSG